MTTTTTPVTTAAAVVKGGRPLRRFAKIASLVAVPAAVAVSGLVVSQASYSAYSATTVNPTNNWATGTVALTDDDTNTAAFTATNLKPGSTGTRCIAVTSTGTLPSAVKLYATTPASTKNLAAHIDLTISQGTGGTFGDCSGYTQLPAGADLYTGTLDQLGKTATGYTTGIGDWTTTGGTTTQTRTYQITYTVNPKAPDTTQGGTAALGLTWEAQNN